MAYKFYHWQCNIGSDLYNTTYEGILCLGLITWGEDGEVIPESGGQYRRALSRLSLSDQLNSESRESP